MTCSEYSNLINSSESVPSLIPTDYCSNTLPIEGRNVDVEVTPYDHLWLTEDKGMLKVHGTETSLCVISGYPHKIDLLILDGISNLYTDIDLEVGNLFMSTCEFNDDKVDMWKATFRHPDKKYQLLPFGSIKIKANSFISIVDGKLKINRFN